MNLLLFGITREIVGASSLKLPPEIELKTVADLKAWLHETYPALTGLNSLAVALDKEYAEDPQALDGISEIALIPPVSGG